MPSDTRLTYFISNTDDPIKNLALEELLLDEMKPGEIILYLWQNRNTVVIGRNQNCREVCRVSKLEEDGGSLVRRLSGGGAMYQDMGNQNFTFLAFDRDYDVGRQLEVIKRAVGFFGIEASKSGRNDILANGRKFSGNAFYRRGDRRYHHGTLLISTDIDMMSQYLITSERKLRSNGVSSVAARTVNLADLSAGITADAVRNALIKAFAEVYGTQPEPFDEHRISSDKLRELCGEYADGDWRYGESLNFTYSASERFPWGGVDIKLCTADGRVSDCVMYSDAIEADIILEISVSLKDCELKPEALAEAAMNTGANTEAERLVREDIANLLRGLKEDADDAI